MSPYLILSLIFISVFLVLFFLLFILRRVMNPTLRRMKKFDETSQDTDKASPEGETGIKTKITDKVIDKALDNISRISKKEEQGNSKLRQTFIQAGYHSERSVRIFIFFKIMTTIAFFGLFFYLGTLINRPVQLILVLSFLFALVGYQIPDIILNAKVKKRQGTIAASLSDAIDLLVITVEAGLGMNAAILKVGEDLAIRCPPLAEELARVNRDIRTGSSREEALRDLSRRNNVEDLRIFVGALVLADRLGTSIADTLRAQADSLRVRIRQRAEEQAAKAGIKMLLPLVLCILPALIIIVMGPGIIQVVKTFQ